MRTFLMTIIVLNLIRTGVFLNYIFNNEYPRQEKAETRRGDVISIVIAWVFITWAWIILRNTFLRGVTP